MSSSIPSTSEHKKPPNAFMIYRAERIHQMKIELENLPRQSRRLPKDYAQIISAEWHAMSRNDQRPYFQRALALLEEYKSTHGGAGGKKIQTVAPDGSASASHTAVSNHMAQSSYAHPGYSPQPTPFFPSQYSHNIQTPHVPNQANPSGPATIPSYTHNQAPHPNQSDWRFMSYEDQRRVEDAVMNVINQYRP